MHFTAPDEFTRRMASQVIYQIFPERFAIGGQLTSTAKLATPAYDVPGAVTPDWDAAGTHPVGGHDFFGGDLDGITENLDYLQDLGVTGVYLTPIFPAPSNHKYDATDFFNVDPMFGGNAALDRLIAALHGRSMALTLDAVLNHVSNQHPWFLAALAGDPSKRDWFSFNEEGQYLCWQDNVPMPELNLANPEVRDVLYRRPESMVQHWLAKGVDNWRFDVAQDVGIPVAQELRAVIDQQFPRAGLLGELNGFSGSWFQAGNGFHGMMNYWYRTAILAWLAGDIDAIQMNHAVKDAVAAYGLNGLLCSWNMLSSHDTPRLLASVSNAAQAQLAVLMQFTLPGVPLIYYGEENGMQGGADPDCRRPMCWDTSQWNHGQREWIKRLIAIRQNSPGLQYGNILVLGDRINANALVFLRYTQVPGEESLVIINHSATPFNTLLLLPYSHWYDGLPLRDALQCSPDTKMQAGSIRLVIGPNTAAIYQPADAHKNYTYFKPRNRVASQRIGT